MFIWDVALVVSVATSYTTGGTFGLTSLKVLDTSDITQYFDHVKSSSVSQLIKGKSRDVQKLLKYFNGPIFSAFGPLLLFDVLPIAFVLYLKDLLVVVF